MLVPGKKSYDRARQSIKNQRHQFANKDLYNQSYSFSSSRVWMWEWDHEEGWVLKNWRLLKCGIGEDSRVPWTARKSNQSILKHINPQYSFEGLMLEGQYFGHLMQRVNSFEKTLMLGKIEGRRRRQQRMRCLDGITDSKDKSLSKL